MKLFVFLFVFISVQAWAVNVCDFMETSDFRRSHFEIRSSADHFQFSALEQQLIHEAVNLSSYRGPVSQSEALKIFGDFSSSQLPGYNAGEILYFSVRGKELILVHYWPGENEYGAFFELSGTGAKIVATVSDSFIECR
jgi:hypothetical protein